MYLDDEDTPLLHWRIDVELYAETCELWNRPLFILPLTKITEFA